MAQYYDGDTFERGGREFRVRFPRDDFSDAPWEREDGHGPVTDWTSRAKRPGERVLNQAHGSQRRYYDMQGAVQIARRDGWGLCSEDIAALGKRLGRTPTKGDICAEAVARDFEHLRRWCCDEWQYVGVVVTLASAVAPKESESIWGIESDAGGYLAEVAHELADEINARVDSAMARDIQASRPDMYGHARP